MEDYRKRLFESTFDNVYNEMIRRKENDSQFTKEQFEGVLQGLYVDQGNDWGGRGEIRDIVNEATIAACEVVMCEWEPE